MMGGRRWPRQSGAERRVERGVVVVMAAALEAVVRVVAARARGVKARAAVAKVAARRG